MFESFTALATRGELFLSVMRVNDADPPRPVGSVLGIRPTANGRYSSSPPSLTLATVDEPPNVVGHPLDGALVPFVSTHGEVRRVPHAGASRAGEIPKVEDRNVDLLARV